MQFRSLKGQPSFTGINTSNIIQGGRRPRTAVDYSAILKPKYEEIDEEASTCDL